MDAVERYLADNAGRFVEELKELLRIPSISADSAYRARMHEAAGWVRDKLAAAGLDSEVIPTEKHPLVFGEWSGAAGAPTVLVYGHYDVQPPDPLEEWVTPPFEPDIRDGHIYARGATDDKGQMFTHIKSVEAWMRSAGRLPVNVKFLIEGEEEVGGHSLETFLERHADRCRCDVVVVSDTSQYAPGRPAITYGLRGNIFMEVIVRGPSQDLHSGMFGGSVANPANALARMIAAVHDADGRVHVPGFYDDVVPLSEEERRRLAELPFDEAAYLEKLGVPAAWGEAGYTTLERRWARPTFDVSGIKSGYLGEGPKSIVPSKASAKIGCRLVPNQDPHALGPALRTFLTAQCLPGLQVEFLEYGSGRALVFDTGSAWMGAARRAIRAAFGVEPVLIREGGSIPVVASFRERLGVDTLLLGWGQDTDNLHSPNERFCLADFERGIRASARLWRELALASESSTS
ncbi:MAG TPA: dipeptidase [Planctomycetaceae bacterium]|nr:dipeptidase [Planctomycetaceae bacterium]